ncbi:hypothetical protein [Sinomonas gamaensis]|jgi:hypothetical protein|uniref:hypothetical protein n=1 Tax=Sinomonas gamaensis TaxID=2565624 RepID=UPI001109138A|nr:hypothetical protein [Sinomonas gamaensis]
MPDISVRDRSQVRALIPWLAAPAVAGVPLGLVWWLAAPGGRLQGDGSDYHAWLARDLVFAALAAFAALVVVVFVVRANSRGDFAPRQLSALIGSGVGSVLMWLTGVGLGQAFGTLRTDPSVDGSAFGLQALSALALWPGIVAVVILGLMTIFWSPPTRG